MNPISGCVKNQQKNIFDNNNNNNNNHDGEMECTEVQVNFN